MGAEASIEGTGKGVVPSSSKAGAATSGSGAQGTPRASKEMSPKDRLYLMTRDKPYLENTRHHLNVLVREVHNIVNSESAHDQRRAHEIMNRLQTELDVEAEALARAFNLFDNRKRRELNKADVKNMNRYLGFPCEDKDVDELMKVVDKDGGGTVDFQEFEAYVGRMGGSERLFEERQQRMKEKLGAEAGSATTADLEDSSLKQAGIDQEAQAYWKFLLPREEFEEVSKLEDCQKKALSGIRRLAKKSHELALPKLQGRLKEMGIPDDDLWITLSWIRELAPIILHVHLDKMLQYFENDTHYRNQFETNTSGGLLKPEVRKKWEHDLFNGAYDKATPFQRPKYGVQNVMNDHRGVTKCKQYGTSYLILKNVRLRCTFAPEDSANLKSDKLAVPDFYAHVLAEYSPEELRETVKVATSADAALLGDSDKVGKMKYKEAQIHGPVCWAEHVERLVVYIDQDKPGEKDRLRPRLEAVCKKHGWKFSFMDEEQDRMKKESMHKLGGQEFAKRLQEMQESIGKIEVPEGFCKVGCGRCVAPGVTRSGKPFTTCCRGCVMGFGHDQTCQNIDPTKVGPGLCKNGCGKKVAPGRGPKGQQWTTCCRGCALHLGCDATCQKVVEPGMCKMGCGRKVAPGTTRSGRPFDTCCKNCAVGKGHSEEFIE